MTTESPIDPRSGSEARAERAVLTATELRQVAEWAHSVRGPDMCMVVLPRKPGEPLTFTPMRSIEAKALPLEECIIIPVDTENRVKDRESIGDMKLTLKGKRNPEDKGKEVDFFKECREKFGCEPDAMFWTESSVEKFLVPYYASVYSADETLGERMDCIAAVFDDAAALQSDEVESDEEVTVYAMVHLPKSEYVASPPDEPMLAALCLARRKDTTKTDASEPTELTVRPLVIPLCRTRAGRARAGRA